jgi:Prolipoprotein diacylglyceryl transferase
MDIEIFITGLGIFLAVLFMWSFSTLPKERWQIIGAVPVRKNPQGGWTGVNFTYYGFFNACACTLAASIFLLLLGAVQVPLKITVVFFIILMAVCLPAARLVAYLVEKRWYTFSIGGAAFVGIVFTPWLVVSMRSVFESWTNSGIQAIPVLAALSIAYAFGEGVGRLACISFGCCYGKPLDDVHPLFQKIFRHCNFVFNGHTRKIVYAHGFGGIQVVPVQALTAVIYCSAGLVGLYVFSKSHFTAAFIIGMLVTQAWRFGSEFLRADYRGESRISKYQIMAGMAVVYSLIIAYVFPEAPVAAPSISAGLKILWQPSLIIFLQLLWMVVFVYTGKSQVTGSQISFHVIKDRI